MWRLVWNAFSRIIRLKENVISLHAIRRIFFFLVFRHCYYYNTLLSFSCPTRDKPVSPFIPVDCIVNRLISSFRRTNLVEMTFSSPNLSLKYRKHFLKFMMTLTTYYFGAVTIIPHDIPTQKSSTFSGKI